MAIAFSEVIARNTTTGTTNVITGSRTGVTDGMALVWVECATAGIDPDTVEWGSGNQMTKINTFTTGTTRLTQISLWAKRIGTTSTGSVTITATFAASRSSSMLGAIYSGVSQSIAEASMQASTNGTSGAATTTNFITTAITPSNANSWLVAFGIDLAASRTVVAGTVMQLNTNWTVLDSGAPVSGSSTLALTLGSSALYGVNAIVLAPSVSTNTSIGFFGFV
jgi:hypothetical protein